MLQFLAFDIFCVLDVGNCSLLASCLLLAVFGVRHLVPLCSGLRLLCLLFLLIFMLFRLFD